MRNLIKIKKTAVIGLILAAVMAVSGCTSGQKPDSSTPQENSSAEQGTISPEGKFPIVADKIELTVMVPNDPTVEDLNTNDFTKYYEDLTNVKIKWNVIPSDSLSDKVNISLSSGDMPDIYLNCGISQSQQLAYGSQGAFCELNGYIKQYGAIFQRIMDSIPNMEQVVKMDNGSIYALPNIDKCPHCEVSSKLWVNTKWLEALKLEVPTTVDEFEAMLKAFQEKDPNGNGEADEISLLSFDGGWQSDAISGYLMNPFVYTAKDNQYVYLQDDKIALSYNQSGWKDGLKWLNKLYTEGLYFDQSLVMSNDQAKQVAANGKDGVAVVGCFPNGVPSAVPGDTSEDWGNYVAIPPIEGPAGRNATWYAYSQIQPNRFIITSKCKYPEAAFRWGVEQYNKELTLIRAQGPKDVGWKEIQPGEDDIPADAVDRCGLPVNTALGINGVAWGDKQNFAWRGIGINGQSPDVPDLFYSAYEPGDYETNMEYRLAGDTRTNMEPYRPDISICLPPLVYTEEESTQLANIESVIISYVQEMAARFITGDANLEQEWDAYLKELEVKGVTQLSNIYQAAYDRKYQ